jgi:hypothetical protein
MDLSQKHNKQFSRKRVLHKREISYKYSLASFKVPCIINRLTLVVQGLRIHEANRRHDKWNFLTVIRIVFWWWIDFYILAGTFVHSLIPE